MQNCLGRHMQFLQIKNPLCFGKTFKFPVFSLTGNSFGHFSFFLYSGDPENSCTHRTQDTV